MNNAIGFCEDCRHFANYDDGFVSISVCSRIGESGALAALHVTALDDSDLTADLAVKPNFGCVLFEGMRHG